MYLNNLFWPCDFKIAMILLTMLRDVIWFILVDIICFFDNTDIFFWHWKCEVQISSVPIDKVKDKVKIKKVK